MLVTTEIAEQNDWIPLNVVDGKGQIIQRAIKSFNTETGEVVSLIMDREGEIQMDWDKGEAKTRTETFLAPLTWYSVTKELCQYYDKQLWDLEGK